MQLNKRRCRHFSDFVRVAKDQVFLCGSVEVRVKVVEVRCEKCGYSFLYGGDLSRVSRALKSASYLIERMHEFPLSDSAVMRLS